MTPLVGADVLDRAANTIGEALPRIGGALLLLLVGIPLAIFAGRVARRLLAAIGVDALSERSGVHDVLERIGLERSASRLLGRAVRIALIVVVVAAVVSLLGLAALSGALNSLVLFVPRLFVALALVLLGVVLSEFVGDRAARLADELAVAGPIRQLVQVTILSLFILMALAQLGIPTEILFTLIVIALAAAAFAGALALGLGGREVAREVSAGRYLAGTYELGQTIRIGDVRGEIVALERAATVLRTDDGRTIRIPNHLVLDSIVTLDEGAEQAPPGPPAA